MFIKIFWDIVVAILRFMPYALATGIFVVLVYSIFISGKEKKVTGGHARNNRKKLFLVYMFYVYCYMVVSITFLSREPGSRDGLDLKLFSTFTGGINGYVFPIENILLFLPFGFILPLLWRRSNNFFWCMAAGFFFSCAIEVSQYITGRGYCQIDDVMTNVVGSLIGFTVLYGLRALRNRRKPLS